LPAALADALRVAPTPYIFNSDQGSQSTSLAYEQALLDEGCRISRDGRGRATDNTFIERLWRTVKWEHIYLNLADDGHHLYHQLQAYFAYYNYRRPHQSLGGPNARPSLRATLVYPNINALFNKPC
jgi:putative transposase